MIRLLIADDERLEREALVEMVSRRFEHEVVLETAENGRKAADTAILWGADLILMDIEMPGMSGLDAARAVLAQRPGCRVVFVTAYSLFQYAHEAVHLGACDYLLKPVDPDELEASIRRAIRQIETERKLEALAPVQPEPEAPTAPEAPAPAHPESENQQTALVMAHVRRYLEDNYMFDISLDSVGEILHISPAYLSAQFKKYQKMNFLDCLTELRINAAKELLADPFRSSAEVASMVGYEDASYFARAFKKRRLGNMSSKFGALYDSVLDRYSELMTFFGICYYLSMKDYFLYALIAFVALIGSLMVSYVRARAEGLGIECKVGFMQRPERVVLTSLGALFCGVFKDITAFEPILILIVPLAFVALFANITAFARVRHCYKAMKE